MGGETIIIRKKNGILTPNIFCILYEYFKLIWKVFFTNEYKKNDGKSFDKMCCTINYNWMCTVAQIIRNFVSIVIKTWKVFRKVYGVSIKLPRPFMGEVWKLVNYDIEFRKSRQL